VTDLGPLPWPDVAARAARSLLAIPLGATEQHGPHLPLSTDTDVAVALAGALAARRADVLVAPALPYGSSGEHAAFAGTLSIGQAATETVLIELGRSADAFSGVLFVSAHGGNAAPLRRAVEQLVSEGSRARAWSPPPDPAGDAHAGRTETSLLLALSPATVRTGAAAAGARQPLAELWPALRQGGVGAVSPNGVLGDPSGASAASGQRMLDAWADDLVAAVEGWP
jgi:creatinine amidohydrolase